VLNINEARFRSFVQVGDGDECWNWTGRIHDGYGEFKSHKRILRAHRIALWLVQPPPTPETYCCHRCNNKLCCNPAHLYWGDAKTNALDRIAAGVHRAHQGVKQDVRRKAMPLLRLGLSHREIARRLGCSKTSITDAAKVFHKIST
jgi:hypothetical protein